MFCSKCGSQVKENDKFCSSCGNAILPRENKNSFKEAFTKNGAQQFIHNLSNPDFIKRNFKNIAMGIILIIVVIIAGVLIYDACTTSADEASERLRRTKREIYDLQSEIYDLEIKKSIIESLID